MTLRTKDTKKVLLTDILEATSTKSRMLGLLMQTEGTSLLLHTRFGIHTFGMKFPIDVLVLDKKGVVRSLRKGLSQGRIYVWNPLFSTVIEAPLGTIDTKHIAIGDRLELE